MKVPHGSSVQDRRHVFCCSPKIWTTCIALLQIIGCSIGLTGTILYLFSGSAVDVVSEGENTGIVNPPALPGTGTSTSAAARIRTGTENIAGGAEEGGGESSVFSSPTASHIYKIRITSSSGLNSASITLAAFLVITLIHGVERGIVLLLGVQQEKTCVLKIWMVLMLTDIILNAVGFITLLVIRAEEDFYNPSTVFLVAIILNMFFIYTVNEYKIKLQLKNIDRKFGDYVDSRGGGDPSIRFANDYDIKL